MSYHQNNRNAAAYDHYGFANADNRTEDNLRSSHSQANRIRPTAGENMDFDLMNFVSQPNGTGFVMPPNPQTPAVPVAPNVPIRSIGILPFRLQPSVLTRREPTRP
ncbi:uncharacterized protein LOC122617497 isoform X2 [Drosophila teissieri]|uniref:uncharacterized protein LOC122617497 isoform X2 n=1 Tax=Drosophila teissieri TaxID=7243 RepID=UPI001CBA125F|nr:uncharacterized protein LOC122617497 isoform X2 [Drosophila teissieri]